MESGIDGKHMETNLNENAGKPPPQPGRFGRFYLQELINSGGMADIWLATDAKGEAFALRRLHQNLRFNFTARRRFVRGCEILSQIHEHDKVIGYFEHGKIEGSHYLLMEYVEGSNLRQLQGRSDPTLGENLAQIMIDMAVALEHVHQSGFLHLDYKPENILVSRNASVRLVDFDLARRLPEKPKKMPGNPGTPAYMAPEQLQRQGIDQRTDIYAFGVTAYEMLTAAKPFPGESPEEILRRELQDELISPRQYNADLPPALEKIILKCLRRDMAERYPYMSVVVRDLEQALYV
ncbi:MAG: serine/threonine-protein kinase [Verrucomicrobiota bacterium]|jgi:serine/threonine-protein kinase